jgi:hypothetical protein
MSCLVLVASRISAYAVDRFSRAVLFPLSTVCFTILSITKLHKVADKESPCVTPHFTINSSVRSLFTLTLALVCLTTHYVSVYQPSFHTETLQVIIYLYSN